MKPTARLRPYITLTVLLLPRVYDRLRFLQVRTMIHHINNERQAMNPEESATDRELDQFYGTPPTEEQVQESIARFTAAFDADDLVEIVSENAKTAVSFLRLSPGVIGDWLDYLRKETIAGWVSKELYGKTGVITAKDIK